MLWTPAAVLFCIQLSSAVILAIVSALVRVRKTTKSRRGWAPMEDQEKFHTSNADSACEKGHHHIVRESGTPRKVLEVTTGNGQSSILERQRPEDTKKARAKRPAAKAARTERSRAATRAVQEVQRESCQPLVPNPTQGTSNPFADYEKYRTGQCSNTTSGREGKWPDELEDAFIDALEVVGDLGKRKEHIGETRLGVNELIGSYVCMIAGTDRYRKQISSHKQVIKHKLPFGDDWSAHLVEWKRLRGGPSGGDSGVDKKRAALWAYIGDVRRKAADSTRRIVRKKLKRALRSRKTVKSVTAAAEAAAAAAAAAGTDSPAFRPVSFAMWVQCLGPQSLYAIENSVHIYTSLDVSGSLTPPDLLDNMPAWRKPFPYVWYLYHQGALTCEVCLLETSLNLTVPSLPLAKIELATQTQFEVLVPPPFAGHLWHCTTRIYSSGSCVWTVTQPVPVIDSDHGGGGGGRRRRRAGSGGEGGGGSIRLQPPFASEFWDQMLAQISAEGLEINGPGPESHCGRHVQNMSAVLELCGTQGSADGQPDDRAAPQRLALFLWRFSDTTSASEAGKTTWRTLIPPAARILGAAAPLSPHPLVIPTTVAPHVDFTQLWHEMDAGCGRPSIPVGFEDDDEAYESQQPTLQSTGGVVTQQCLPAELLTSAFYSPFDSDLQTDDDLRALSGRPEAVHGASSGVVSTGFHSGLGPGPAGLAVNSFLPTGAAADDDNHHGTYGSLPPPPHPPPHSPPPPLPPSSSAAWNSYAHGLPDPAVFAHSDSFLDMATGIDKENEMLNGFFH